MIKFESENYNRSILIHLNAQIKNKEMIKLETLFKILRRIKIRYILYNTICVVIWSSSILEYIYKLERIEKAYRTLALCHRMELTEDEQISINMDKYNILLGETENINRNQFLTEITFNIDRSKLDFFETTSFLMVAWMLENNQPCINSNTIKNIVSISSYFLKNIFNRILTTEMRDKKQSDGKLKFLVNMNRFIYKWNKRDWSV